MIQPGNTWVSRIEPPEVTVRVNIVTKLVDRVWTNVPVLAILEPGSVPNLKIQPEAVTVNVRGRAEVMDGLSNNQVRVFVDCASLVAGETNSRPTIAYLPPGVDVTAKVIPDHVDIVVSNTVPE